MWIIFKKEKNIERKGKIFQFVLEMIRCVHKKTMSTLKYLYVLREKK